MQGKYLYQLIRGASSAERKRHILRHSSVFHTSRRAYYCGAMGLNGNGAKANPEKDAECAKMKVSFKKAWDFIRANTNTSLLGLLLSGVGIYLVLKQLRQAEKISESGMLARAKDSMEEITEKYIDILNENNLQADARLFLSYYLKKEDVEEHKKLLREISHLKEKTRGIEHLLEKLLNNHMFIQGAKNLFRKLDYLGILKSNWPDELSDAIEKAKNLSQKLDYLESFIEAIFFHKSHDYQRATERVIEAIGRIGKEGEQASKKVCRQYDYQRITKKGNDKLEGNANQKNIAGHKCILESNYRNAIKRIEEELKSYSELIKDKNASIEEKKGKLNLSIGLIIQLVPALNLYGKIIRASSSNYLDWDGAIKQYIDALVFLEDILELEKDKDLFIRSADRHILKQDLSITLANLGVLLGQIAGKRQNRKSHQDGYDLLLMSEKDFNKNAKKLGKPIFVKMHNGDFKLWGDKSGQGDWQETELKNFDSPKEWENKEIVFVSPIDKDIFNTLNKGHASQDSRFLEDINKICAILKVDVEKVKISDDLIKIAIECHKKSITKGVSNANVLNSYANTLLEKLKMDIKEGKALNVELKNKIFLLLDEAIKIDPNQSASLMRLARLYKLSKKKDEALSLVKMVLEAESYHEYALKKFVDLSQNDCAKFLYNYKPIFHKASDEQSNVKNIDLIDLLESCSSSSLFWVSKKLNS